MDQTKAEKLFLKSKFKIIHKSLFDSDVNKEILKKLNFNIDLNRFHPDRKSEFLLSRILIHQVLNESFHMDYYDFSVNEDRSPNWPAGFIGSISHTKEYVAIAISNTASILGIDIEQIDRMKSEIANKIIINEDVKSVLGLEEAQLNTLIFSAKEALYKALYPKVKKFFGFDYAYVSAVDVLQNSFEIRLAKHIDENWNPDKVEKLQGRFFINNNHCLAIIES